MYSKLFTLLLSFLIIIAIGGCKKKDTPQPSSYTSKMGGVRNWRGSHSYNAYGMHYTTPVHEYIVYPDTSFAVTIVNDSTINFGGAVFGYEQTDTAKQIYFFGKAWEYYTYGADAGVAYYYAKDSIVYCHGDRHATSDTWQLDDLYYTL